MNNLVNLLNTIAEEFECEIIIGDEFAYYYAENLIVIDIQDKDTNFVEFARKNGLNEKVSSFVFSFFHELGHNETIDEVEEEFEGDKDALSLEDYYCLEEEWLATEWAINFCNNNLDLVEKIQKYL